LRTMSSAECRFRPAIGFIVPSSPTSGHRTLELVGLIQREHAMLLNPTPALLEELGYPTADALRKTVHAREHIALAQHHYQQDLDTPGHEL
jgi:hypothetical protein